MAAYEIDSYANTSKPVVPDKPKYFTRIPYNKGASLLHMLSNTITPGVLQHGLQSYLQKYQYSNTNYTDLWSEITEVMTYSNVKC
ncbi:unnamed protein product [Anisakis simplex]|uniref:Peptidase M1 membrane alanine aminopeptidase domain-containing protein n=1 Tax=Anisakis simplex TaxID=6269 RepID=A0A3P6NWG5_ANISI|nr:unnamed protein product [Anisakis simplex]